MRNEKFVLKLEDYICEHYKDRVFSSLDSFEQFVAEKSMRAVSSALVELRNKGTIKRVGSIPIPRGGSPRALYKFIGKPHEVLKTSYVDTSKLFAQQNNAQLMIQDALNAMARRGASR